MLVMGNLLVLMVLIFLVFGMFLLSVWILRLPPISAQGETAYARSFRRMQVFCAVAFLAVALLCLATAINFMFR